MENSVGLFGIIWSIFLLFLLIAWIWVLVSVVSDIFRSKDMNGLSKAIWLGFVIIIPWLGVLSYIVIRGDKMQAHALDAISREEEARRNYIRSVVQSSPADELERLVALKEKGVLTEDEFAAQKAKILAG